MNGLEHIITIGLPVMVLTIAGLAAMLAIVSGVYHHILENNMERIEDMMDTIHYKLQEEKELEKKRVGKKYVTRTEAATAFKIFWKSRDLTKPFTRSSSLWPKLKPFERIETCSQKQ